MFSFEDQLKLGNEGEQLFGDIYPSYRRNNGTNVRKPDFEHTKTGVLAEVKYDDSRRAAVDEKGNQKNFFMEQYSNEEYQTDGGVFRAEKENVTYFVYMFKHPFAIHKMDTKKTRAKCAELIASGQYRRCRIPNRGYYTIGYPLPIPEFSDCMVDDDTFRAGSLTLGEIYTAKDNGDCN